MGRIPITACAAADFPHPDSPTKHKHSPRRTRNEMSRTAWMKPLDMRNETFRFFTSSAVGRPANLSLSFIAFYAFPRSPSRSLPIAQFWIECVAEGIIEKEKSQHRERHNHAGQQ